MWVVKEQAIFNELESEITYKIASERNRLHSGVSGAGSSYYEHHFDKAAETLSDMFNTLCPWVEKEEKGNNREGQYSSSVAAWEEEFGIKVGSDEWNELERNNQQLLDSVKEG